MTDQKGLATTQQGGAVAWEPREVIKLNAYPRDKYNLLVSGSMAMQVTPFMRPLVREVTLDPDPAGGDVYPITQRKVGDRWVASEVGISAVGLANLGSTAGTLDVPQGSGRVDSGADPRTCTYRATMAMRMPDGSWRVLSRECTVKLATIEKEIRDQKVKKGGYEKPAWDAAKIEAEVRKELLLKEKFLERLAETGAKTRCYRALFGIKTKYTAAEIARPFVIAQVVPDMTAPEVRERYLDQATSSTNSLFGGMGGSSQPPRALAAGPTQADVASAEQAPTEEMGADELGELGIIEGQVAEVPDWMAGATAPARHKLLALLQDSAAGSDLAGDATPEQLTAMREALAPFPKDAVVAVMGLVFGTKLVVTDDRPAGILTFTAAQAHAILTVSNSLAIPEFRALWIELAQIAAAKAGAA